MYCLFLLVNVHISLIGRVKRILRGSDGWVNCIYEVLYEGEKEPHEVDHLIEDYRKDQVKILQ